MSPLRTATRPHRWDAPSRVRASLHRSRIAPSTLRSRRGRPRAQPAALRSHRRSHVDPDASMSGPAAFAEGATKPRAGRLDPARPRDQPILIPLAVRAESTTTCARARPTPRRRLGARGRRRQSDAGATSNVGNRHPSGAPRGNTLAPRPPRPSQLAPDGPDHRRLAFHAAGFRESIRDSTGIGAGRAYFDLTSGCAKSGCVTETRACRPQRRAHEPASASLSSLLRCPGYQVTWRRPKRRPRPR